MQQTYKTTDLAPDERMAVERLVGRPLQSDEAGEVLVHKFDEMQNAQAVTTRLQAARRIRELAKRADARLPHGSGTD